MKPEKETLLVSEERETPKYPPRYVPKRVIVVVFCALANVICYADRVNFSVAMISLAKLNQWDKTQQGYLFSAFWIGYSLSQVLGGYLAHKLGGKWIIFSSVVTWSICTVVTPACTGHGLVLIAFVRFLIG
jgi:sugar phosphate permease